MTTDAHDRAYGMSLLREFHSLPPDDRRRATLREQCVHEYLPLVHYLARRMAQRSEVLPDLVQVGSIGLLNAIDRFDPGRGVEFATFAVPTISGEIRRYFRDTGWCLHVPRRAQELQTAIREAEAALSQELGRSPTLAEVAERVDVEPERVLEAKEVALARNPVSTDAPTSDGETPEPMPLVAFEDGFEQAEVRALLRPALEKLPGREREILMLRFMGERTQAEIARIVGVSQMQVSRLITRSLGELRAALGEDALREPPLISA
ncbi:MAG: SigB/SigF/SigG family RNA polymerase sigma factor [Jatrophihabitans sp.]|uniref:SigB/SigF/SigG family RNA polymerase sigma factor n=1 Tax=Jatrophihabitans sp. TaxID=1932789 RepID=UPI003F7D751B